MPSRPPLGRLALVRTDLGFRALQAFDLAPHGGAIGGVEGEEDRHRRIARRRDVGVDEDASEIGPVAALEVHRQEGDLGGDVVAAEGVRELDAVEDVDAGRKGR